MARDHQPLNPSGSGLGLYLSRNLARLMKGDITVKSKLNKGTKFIVRLPVGDRTEKVVANTKDKGRTKESVGQSMPKNDTTIVSTTITADIKASNTPNFGDSTVNLKEEVTLTRFKKRRTTVLIVEDNMFNSFLLSRVIDGHTLDSDTADNGMKAIEMVKARYNDPYALILMDINMPIMLGSEVKKSLTLGYCLSKEDDEG